MINIGLDAPQMPLRILCLGAHSDDIEIGCGGTILRLLNTRRCHVDWVVFSAKKSRRREALHGARLFLRGAKTKNVVISSFTDGFFPYQGAKIKRRFESMKRTMTPSLIFTHYREDLHQDHRVINELTWNTFRNHLILEYEIPKYDGGLGSPNFFVELKDSVRRLKLDHLHTAFASQRTKHWFSEDVFSGLLRLRGVEAAAASRFAEAFYSRKLCL